MPPKGQKRREAAKGKKKDDADIKQPALPGLKGTASSRFNFSYGAETDFAPSHPGKRLLENEVVDLEWAVRDAQRKHKIAEEAEEVYIERPDPPPRQPRQNPQRAKNLLDEDELAGEPLHQQRPPVRESPRASMSAVLSTLTTNLNLKLTRYRYGAPC